MKTENYTFGAAVLLALGAGMWVWQANKTIEAERPEMFTPAEAIESAARIQDLYVSVVQPRTHSSGTAWRAGRAQARAEEADLVEVAVDAQATATSRAIRRSNLEATRP